MATIGGLTVRLATCDVEDVLDGSAHSAFNRATVDTVRWRRRWNIQTTPLSLADGETLRAKRLLGTISLVDDFNYSPAGTATVFFGADGIKWHSEWLDGGMMKAASFTLEEV